MKRGRNPGAKYHESQFRYYNTLADQMTEADERKMYRALATKEADNVMVSVKKHMPNPQTKVEKISNIMGGMGILAVPLFIGLIVWADRKFNQ